MNTTITQESEMTTQVLNLTEQQVLNRLRKIDKLKAEVKAANEAIKKLQAEIVGDAERLAIDNKKFTLTYKDEGGYRVDTTALKKAHPDIVQQFMKYTPRMNLRYDFK